MLLSASNIYAQDTVKDEYVQLAYASNMGQSDNTSADTHAQHIQSQAEIDELIKNISEKMGAHSEKAGKLLVQDMQGRIKPLDTLAMDMVHKLVRKDDFKGMNHMEIFLGMMMYYDYFQHVKMFPTSSEELRKKLGTPLNEKYVSFSDAYDEMGEYKLKADTEAAYQKNPAHRNKFEKDLIKFDEKMGLAYYM